MPLVSRKGILAIAAVIDVAINARSRPVSAKALAARHKLPTTPSRTGFCRRWCAKASCAAYADRTAATSSRASTAASHRPGSRHTLDPAQHRSRRPAGPSLEAARRRSRGRGRRTRSSSNARPWSSGAPEREATDAEPRNERAPGTHAPDRPHGAQQRDERQRRYPGQPEPPRPTRAPPPGDAGSQTTSGAVPTATPERAISRGPRARTNPATATAAHGSTATTSRIGAARTARPRRGSHRAARRGRPAGSPVAVAPGPPERRALPARPARPADPVRQSSRHLIVGHRRAHPAHRVMESRLHRALGDAEPVRDRRDRQVGLEPEDDDRQMVRVQCPASPVPRRPPPRPRWPGRPPSHRPPPSRATVPRSTTGRRRRDRSRSRHVFTRIRSNQASNRSASAQVRRTAARAATVASCTASLGLHDVAEHRRRDPGSSGGGRPRAAGEGAGACVGARHIPSLPSPPTPWSPSH